MSTIDQFRQPEYTGENRCIPCTVLNVAIATGASAYTATVSSFLGGSVLVLSLTIIYLRGYLIPGTPTLTKRYLPTPVLRWFGKESAPPIADDAIEINPEQVLLSLGVVETCRNNTDLCLTPEFEETWQEHARTVRTHDPEEDALMSVFNTHRKNDQITVDQQGNALVAYANGAVIGQWSSQAAVIADIAAADVLSDRSQDWSAFTPVEIAHLLKSLRIFINVCPECDGSVQMNQEVAESCCHSREVVVLRCIECDTHLFEMKSNNVTIDQSHPEPDQTASAV